MGTIKFTLAAKRLDLDDVPIRKALGNRVVRELRPPARASRRARRARRCPRSRCASCCWDGTTAAASPAAVWSFPDGKKGAALVEPCRRTTRPGASGVGIHLGKVSERFTGGSR